MKNAIKLSKYVFISLLTVFVFACDGEDGEDGLDGLNGPAGQVGPTGATGESGANGQDGVDGNANVITSNWLTADFGTYTALGVATVVIEDSRISQEVLDSYAVLGYYSLNDDYTSVFALPFTDPLLRSFSMENFVNIGEYVAINFRSPGSTSQPINTGFIRYILIESSTTGKNSHGGSNTIDGLKAAGIDVNNYFAVMDYFGLQY